MNRVAVVTPSYRNDLPLAEDLCASIDRYLPAGTEHLLMVPHRDLARFGHLAGPSRRVVSESRLLEPHGLWALPLPTRVRIPPLIDRRIRQQWWCRGVGRVSGWITQQLVKLSACDATDAEVLMFIDSDVMLFRPMDLQPLAEDPVALHRVPLRADLPEHRQWCLAARELLGVHDAAEPASNYIGNLVTWRSANVRQLRERIATVCGEPWTRAIARRRDFSEYILYGVYCDDVVGTRAAGHVAAPSPWTHSIWTADAMPDARSFASEIEPSHVALHVQSTVPMALRTRRRFLQDVIMEHST